MNRSLTFIAGMVIFASSQTLAGQVASTPPPTPGVLTASNTSTLPLVDSVPAPTVPAGEADPARTTDAADAEAARDWMGHRRAWTSWSTATGDWADLRSRSKAAGVTFAASHLLDVSDIPRGSLAGSVLGRGLLDLSVTLDLATLAHLPGGTLFAQYLGKHGHNGSDRTGDEQGFSNIDSDSFRRTGEFWYEQSFGERLRFKVGRVDANTEFAYVDNGKEFLNASMGFSPTIFLLPTYPTPVASINAFVRPTPHLYVNVGVYNGDDPESAQLLHWSTRFLISEAGASWSLGQRGLPGRAGVGVWRHDGEFARLDDRSSVQGLAGTFLVVDQQLWSAEAPADSPRRQVAAFLQYGHTDKHFSEVSEHIGTGVVWTGALARRPGDQLGVGVTSVRFSEFCVTPAVVSHEVSVGTFYKFGLTSWLSLKPDVQFIQSPRSNPRVSRLVVATVRIGIEY